MLPMRTVHFISHNDYIGSGQLAKDVTALGHRVVEHRMWQDSGTIHRIRPQDALVILGGTGNAYADSEYPWLDSVRMLIRQRAHAHAPTLGICLGHQLTAVALGGAVEVSAVAGEERGLTQIAWHTPTTPPAGLNAAQILGTPTTVFSDHADAVSHVPPGTQIWARSDKYVQVLTFGQILTVQFHPEVNTEVMDAWYRDREPECYPDFLSQYRSAQTQLHQTCRRLASWLTTTPADDSRAETPTPSSNCPIL